MIRPFRLARIALAAESLRLRHFLSRIVTRIVFGFVALLMVFGAVIFAHVAAWHWLRGMLPGSAVGLIFAGFDLVLAAIFGVLSMRSTPGVAEREALAVRERALDDAANSLSVSAITMRIAESFMTSRSRR